MGICISCAHHLHCDRVPAAANKTQTDILGKSPVFRIFYREFEGEQILNRIKRVHIIGAPRSGTTLMMELMATCFGFSHYVKEEVSLLRFPQGLPDNAILCTKCPRDHRLVEKILPSDELQWFVSLTRDPRDVVVSRHGLHLEVYWTNLGHWKGWFNNVRAYRNHDRFIEVRYEELVENPDKVQQAIAQRLPFLSIRKKFSEYHRVSKPSRQSLEAMRGLRPIENASIDSWKNHLPRIAGQLEIHGKIDEELIQLGYEVDISWNALLKGVTPDLSPGHFPEFFSKEYLLRYQLEQDALMMDYQTKRDIKLV